MTDTAARHLEGLTLEGDWLVLEPHEPSDDHTGSNYSVGYRTIHVPTGRMGYVKALDYSEALDSEDPARALDELLGTFNAERDLLSQCGSLNLSRIVRALSYGTVRVEGYSPSAVSYLICELADRDARDLRADLDPADFVPALRIAHHAAVAMSQLHAIRVAHQDVKPSNVLVWEEDAAKRSAKLGDLGSAHVEGRPAPHDDLLIPGDCAYAAPETLYRASEILPAGARRFAADVYMLGNLLVFLLTGVTHSGLLNRRLDETLSWTTWSGPYDEVLPALMDAHGEVLRTLREVLHCEISDSITALIDELCCPDPRLRGDNVARRLGHTPFNLQRYVTRLDLLYRRAAIASGRTP